ncbi:MAG: hypothetical protein ACXAEU_17065 [Candidatus Hodarchaeales archaeon]|jgi:hypothetical protein
MAAWTHLKFRNVSSMIDTLNGAVHGTANLADGVDVDGLTFIVDVGGGGLRTTSFTAKGRNWTAAEVVAAISACHADLLNIPALTIESRPDVVRSFLKLVDNTGEIVTVDKTGTANTALGFSAAANTVGNPYANTEVEVMQPKKDGQGVWDVIVYA